MLHAFIGSFQAKAASALSATPRTADGIAEAIGSPDAAETVYLVLEHLAANGRAVMARGGNPGLSTFRSA